jgi:outer membrane protein OmpA-like peptidoglycan-associated protein
MKENVLKILTIALLIFGQFSYAQDTRIKKAELKYDQFNYMDAIERYEALVEDGTADAEVLKKLGNSHYLNANYEEASKWYAQLLETPQNDFEPDYYYRYAQSLKSLQKYAESDIWMEKFIATSKADGRAAKYAAKKNYLQKITANTGNFEVMLAPFNTKSSDFAPSFYKKGVVFSSARDTGVVSRNIHNWNNDSFLNLYRADSTTENSFSVSKLSKKLNTKAHESSSVFTKDGETMYFTRNNYNKGFSRDEKGVSRLKIYRASLIDGEWKKTVELPFNGASYSVAHPALNKAEDKLFFASDMPGTFGESDIYYVDLLADGSFGDPKNLGADINTEGRETFPFVTDSDVLYFSSDGHPGLGGLDVFAVNLAEGQLSDFINLAPPLNTDEDDFSFIIDENTGKGFFASNRPNGVGGDDIYMFTTVIPINFECNQSLVGVVKNKTTMELLTNADVQVLDANGKVLGKTVSDQNGEFEIMMSCNKAELTVIGIKTDFKEDQSSFLLSGNETLVTLLLEPNKMLVEKGDDLADYLDLPIIYFDFDKSNIRLDAQNQLQKVIAYMKQYPQVNIAIGSHTDSRANDTYNKNLSERRAQATKNYIISKGISASRLTAKGYGETQLTNGCDNTTNCSETEHDLNRRSEFIIVKK